MSGCGLGAGPEDEESQKEKSERMAHEAIMKAFQNAPKIKDSGQRQEFSTGSRRDLQTGKGRFDLLPVLALFQLAKHFEGGALKYGDRNWEKGQPLARYMDSAIRHALKHLLGLRDEPHLIAAIWNLSCLMQTDMLIKAGKLPKELDNLPEVMDPEMAESILALLEDKDPLKYNPNPKKEMDIPCGAPKV